jgi:hypothetical protein
MTMKAIKATYKNGKITLSEKPADPGPMEVLVVFPEPADDPWEAVLNEDPPRASFLQFVEQCEKEIKQGKATPLDLDQL